MVSFDSYGKGNINMNNKGLDCLALTIAIIGAINWGLIGFYMYAGGTVREAHQ